MKAIIGHKSSIFITIIFRDTMQHVRNVYIEK